jgi:aerobic-type carbon monoxide dehydrogenase small subunit (CoxS/CutS family)
MDDREKKPPEQENRQDARVKFTRRDFLRGMGTGAIAATMVTAEAPLARNAESALPPGLREAEVRLNINGQLHRVRVKSHWTLLDVLRKELGLTGTKRFCDRGGCGACTVLLQGKSIYACSRLAIEADNKKIVTIEGLADEQTIHPIQRSFIEHDGFQCGFCTSGVIMSVKAFLDTTSRPTIDQMREALSGNVCRCSAYPKILQSAMAAAERAK